MIHFSLTQSQLCCCKALVQWSSIRWGMNLCQPKFPARGRGAWRKSVNMLKMPYLHYHQRYYSNSNNFFSWGGFWKSKNNSFFFSKALTRTKIRYNSHNYNDNSKMGEKKEITKTPSFITFPRSSSLHSSSFATCYLVILCRLLNADRVPHSHHRPQLHWRQLLLLVFQLSAACLLVALLSCVAGCHQTYSCPAVGRCCKTVGDRWSGSGRIPWVSHRLQCMLDGKPWDKFRNVI